jgi:hypothetical protein
MQLHGQARMKSQAKGPHVKLEAFTYHPVIAHKFVYTRLSERVVRLIRRAWTCKPVVNNA